MAIPHPDAVDYALGRSEAETRRLILQATILDPITERLLRGAGLAPGMSVLDVGCGAGDVSMLAARIVGPGGRVVGIDRDPAVLETARRRAAIAGLDAITLRNVALADLSEPHAFDCVVGRYVLIHQSDMSGFLRAAASLVRPGGILAFHEVVLRPVPFSSPPVPEYDRLTNLACTAMRAVAPHHDAADRFAAYFADIGLPPPKLLGETPMGCAAETPLYAWVAESVRSLLPLIEKLGLSNAAELAIETAESRLRAAAVATDSQVAMLAQVCAWVRP